MTTSGRTGASDRAMIRGEEKITYEMAYQIASKNIYVYLVAPWGMRLVSDREHPYVAYIAPTGTRSMAGEMFSVRCPGIGNLDMTKYREGWDCEGLSDEEILLECVENGDMTDDIDALADAILTSWNEED